MNYESVMLIVPLTLAFTEVVKRVLNWNTEGERAKRFIPLIAMAVGIFSAWVLIPYAGLYQVFVNGLVGGLASCGLFDLTKLAKK
jgi:hypothetical protein